MSTSGSDDVTVNARGHLRTRR